MSKENRNSKEYILDMIKSIDKIISYVEKIGNIESYLKDEMAIDAITRNFEIIGEVANKIPQELKTKYPLVPWKQMYGLRNFAVHEYHIIDPIILWEIATEHLIQNRISLEEVLDNEFKL